MNRFFLIGRVQGVPVYVHWTALALAVVALVGGRHRPVLTCFGIVSFAGVMLLHEWGHAFAAKRVGSRVLSIELYPIHGVTRFEIPWSRLEHYKIAWGGCLAQLAISVPLVAWIAFHGYTRFEALNAVIGLFGSMSMLIVGFNLLPIPPLDGSLAWRIIPLLWGRHVDGVRGRWEPKNYGRSRLTIVKRDDENH